MLSLDLFRVVFAKVSCWRKPRFFFSTREEYLNLPKKEMEEKKWKGQEMCATFHGFVISSNIITLP